MSNDKQIPEEIKKRIEKYLRSIVPNPHKHDAPYYTTLDKYEDLKDAILWAIREFSLSGMKWVKASDRLPKHTEVPNIRVTSKISGIVMRGVGMFPDSKTFLIRFLNGTTITEKDKGDCVIEWLDESALSSSSCSESIDGQKVYEVEEVYTIFVNAKVGTQSIHLMEYLEDQGYKLIKSTKH